jgi:hypothetical protein
MGYRGLVDKQNQARDLRAQGWTLTEICEAVGCGKASASLWCRDVDIDQAALELRRRQRSLDGNHAARQRGPNKLQRRKAAEIEERNAKGAARVGVLGQRDLLVAGAALYAGEGTKHDGSVGFANTDPRMVQLFLRWLRTCFEVEESRLRLSLYLHQGLDLEAAYDHWAAATSIPRSQFLKPYRAIPDPSIRKSKHPMGCASVTYNSSVLHREIVGMMNALLSSTAPSGDQSVPPFSGQNDPG